VILDDGGTPVEFHTTATTLGQALEEHGLTLFLGDKVTPGLQERLVPDMVVTILRSTPVQIRVDGHTIRTRTRADTVAGVLGQEGIALVGTDYVTPAMDAPVQADMTIQVTRVREEYIVEFEPIPFKTVWVADPEVEIDNIRLAQAGQLGLNKRRYRVVYENDQEVARFLEDSWAAQSPITKTMAYGTKIVIRTLDTPEGPVEYWRKIRAYLVSYRPASSGKPKDHPRYGYTRLGWKLKKGIVAVDPKVIPLKTNLYVPGYGLARAGDTGGGVKGKLVDLGYGDNDYQSWHWWGDIYLLTPVPPRNKIMWVLPDYPNFPDRRR
jgi:3D (Asp-Asp-Asp) domain-containing protein